MSKDFGSARYWAREMILEALAPGAHAVDATMGNGHDTLWLCEAVGPAGAVDAFDVQPEAVERTRARLSEAGVLERARLHLLGHEHMAEAVAGPVDAVVMNLGWLPGAAHGVTTRVETTLAAARAGAQLLAPGGLMTICVYPGHEEGAHERDSLLEWAEGLDSARYDAMLRRYLNAPGDPPLMLAVRRRD